MTAIYRLDEARDLVTLSVTEQTNAAQIAEVFEKLTRDRRFQRTYQFLSDRRGLEQAPDTPYVRDAVATIHRYEYRFGARRWAILIDPDPVMFGMGRIAESFADRYGVNLRLFTDYDKAVDFLQVTEDAPGVYCWGMRCRERGEAICTLHRTERGRELRLKVTGELRQSAIFTDDRWIEASTRWRVKMILDGWVEMLVPPTTDEAE